MSRSTFINHSRSYLGRYLRRQLVDPVGRPTAEGIGLRLPAAARPANGNGNLAPVAERAEFDQDLTY